LVRVGRKGTIIIPSEVRRKLGISEGDILELSVEDDGIVLRKSDLWVELRRRGRRIRVDLEEAEEEVDSDEEMRLEGLFLDAYVP
jgi:AbrB family looped-hinge helix DNA binding protein